MLISLPAGYTLTTDGRIVKGGPMLISLGAGQSLTSDGRIIDTSPKWDTK